MGTLIARRSRLVAIAVLVAAAAVFVGREVRDAIDTRRYGVAPGSSDVARIAVAGDDVFAVGATVDRGQGAPAMWRFEGDGTKHEVDIPDGATTLSDVAVTSNDVVVVAGSAGPSPAVWTRPVAATGGWKRVFALDPSAGFAELTSLASRAGVTVATGYVQVGAARTAVAVVADRVDGTWTRVPIDDDPASVFAVAATDDGFVAVGSIGTEDAAPAFWRSTDGRTWEPDMVAPDATAGRRTAILAVDGGVAAGRRDLVPGAWHREPGGWTFSGALPSTTTGHSVSAVAVSPAGRAVVVGREIGEGDASRPVAWSYTAATGWTSIAISFPDIADLTDVAVTGDRFVVAGNATARKRTQPVLLELRGSVLGAPATT